MAGDLRLQVQKKAPDQTKGGAHSQTVLVLFFFDV